MDSGPPASGAHYGPGPEPPQGAPVGYDPKTSSCGGSVSVISPDKTLHLIKKILDAAAEADVIAAPCPWCQQNVEMYQDAVNKAFGTDHHIPEVFYSHLMAVAFGLDAKKDAGLDQNIIKAENWNPWPRNSPLGFSWGVVPRGIYHRILMEDPTATHSDPGRTGERRQRRPARRAP